MILSMYSYTCCAQVLTFTSDKSKAANLGAQSGALLGTLGSPREDTLNLPEKTIQRIFSSLNIICASAKGSMVQNLPFRKILSLELGSELPYWHLL